MSLDISFESKDKLFLSIGLISIASAVSVLVQYLTAEQRLVAVIALVIGGGFSFIYGLKLMGDRDKRNASIEYLSRKRKKRR